MARFYDEFYRQKGTKHDELVIKCVTDEKLRNEIINGALEPIEFCFNVESCEGVLYRPVRDFNPSYKTEVICRNGNFIVGYADVVFEVSYTLKDEFCVKIGNESAFTTHRIGSKCAQWFAQRVYYFKTGRACWDPSEVLAEGNPQQDVNVLVEVKPELTDVGSVIRQLKTYRELLGKENYIRKMVVVTYSNVSPGAIELMKNEGIDLVVTEE